MKKCLIAGISSGVGKTTLTLGIMQALKKRGLDVQPYKVGPDYIDTAYHTHITKNSSRNLDAYMLEDELIKYLFNKSSRGKDVAIVEGVMGLYDGYGTDINACSTSYVAKLIKAPVILVIDGKGMAASAAAMVLGYKSLDKEVNIKGVIVNNVKTASHFGLIKEAVEKYTGVEVIGYFPPNPDLSLGSRHLGLVPSAEMEALEEKFEKMGEAVEETIDLRRLLELCESEEVLSTYKPNFPKAKGKTLGIAYDKAFNFYYEDNLQLLKEMGFKLEYFSPLKDTFLPKCDALYIGGGFPEIFAKELEANECIRKAILKVHDEGLPIYAECGGLMYLGEKLEVEDKNFDMVGIFKGTSKMTTGLKRFGYSEGTAQKDTILSKKGSILKGHEFHYSEFETTEEAAYKMQKVRAGKVLSTWEGGYAKKNTLASYLHLHFYTQPEVLEQFLSYI